MKNKIRLKKYYLFMLLLAICLPILFLIININENKTINTIYNNKISSIVYIIKEKYPDITDDEIIELLKSDKTIDNKFFYKYGIDVENYSSVKEIRESNKNNLIINISYILGVIIIFILIFIIYNYKKEKDTKEIIKLIEEINKRNYNLKINTNTEDELSILKNEIYKTTIMLKEAADNSNKDKINLKKSLEDISHQLKTPLTSILVMLDNIIEDPEMDEDIRNDFIRDIKREVVNINFLVQSLLKLSKFDSNTIKFFKEDNKVKDIVNESIKNVSILCDLRNITIEKKGKFEGTINCDFKWQVEALTNIIKNCVEHSPENSKIIIDSDTNNVYTKIEIKDFGDGISSKDIKHIFERFYKGENATADSIGIGLALSKTIIEENDGTITVDSNEKGTKFTIKYYNI